MAGLHLGHLKASTELMQNIPKSVPRITNNDDLRRPKREVALVTIPATCIEPPEAVNNVSCFDNESMKTRSMEILALQTMGPVQMVVSNMVIERRSFSW